MNRAYLTIFCILLALPVLAAAVTVTYICFKLNVFAGIVAVIICFIAIAAAITVVIVKIKFSDK